MARKDANRESSYSSWKTKFKRVGTLSGKLVGMTFSSLAPGITEATRSTADTLRETRTFISKSRNQLMYQSKIAQSNTSGRNAMNVLKSAFDDIKSGSYDIGKMSDSSFDLEEDFDKSISDFNSQMGSGTDPDTTNMLESKKNAALIGKTISHGNAATIGSIQKMSDTLASVNLKSTKAQTSQISNLMLLSMNHAQAANMSIVGKLDAINTNIISIMDHQRDSIDEMNEQTRQYQSSMLDLVNTMGENMAKMQDMMGNSKLMDSGDDFDFSNGFNMSSYIEMIKKNFNNSMFGMAKSSAGMLLDMGKMAGNPMEMILPMLIGGLAPDKIKKPMARLDKTLTQGIDNFLYRIGDMKYSSDFFKSTIGEIFGKDRRSLGRVNMGNFKKDAMTWNGVAQKYLTEVIPSYLAKIESGINGTNERYYNTDSGRFQDLSKIEADFKKQLSNSIEFSFSETADLINDQLQKLRLSPDISDNIRDKINESINEAVYSTSGTPDQRRRKIAQTLHNQLGDKVDSNTLHDMFIQMNQELTDTMESIDQTVKNLNDAQRNLFNTEEKKLTDYANKGNIFSGRLFTSEGLSIDDIEDDLDRMRARQLADTTSEEGQGKIFDAIMKKTLGSDYKNKSIYKNLLIRANPIERKRRAREQAGRADRLVGNVVNPIYDFLSGYNFDNNSSSDRSSSNLGGGSRGPARPRDFQPPAVISNSPRIKSGAGRGDIISSADIQDFSFDGTLNDSQSSIENRARKSNERMKKLMDKSANTNGPNSANTAEEAIINRFTDNENSIKTLILSLYDNFLAPMVGGIFGKNGFIRKTFSKENMAKISKKLFDENDGIFKGLSSWFKDQMDYLKHIFTGRAYTTRKGEKIGEDKNSVFDHIANGYDWVFQKTMIHIFGEDYENNEAYKKFASKLNWKKKRDEKREKRMKEEGTFFKGEEPNEESSENKSDNTIKGSSSNSTNGKNTSSSTKSNQNSGLNSSAHFGSEYANAKDNVDPKEEAKKQQASMNSTFGSMVKKFLPAGMAAGVVGGAFGLLTKAQGTGALGSLVFTGGPIAGAILGVSALLLKRSETFQNILFGEKSEKNDGKRMGGLISNKTQEFFKKNAPLLVGGAALGALKGVFRASAIGGPGGFLLNTLLPGGVVGGAIMGLGISLLKSNDRFMNILFGDKHQGSDKKKSVSIGKKLSEAFSKSKHFLKGGAKGLAIGAGAGLTLNQMGIIGGALSVGGPVGMGLMGLGLGIANQSERVKEMLWGTEEFDENGKSKGRFKNGLFPKMRNYLVLNVFEPIKNTLQDKVEDFGFWLKKNISRPFRLAFGPILDSFKEIKKNIADTVHDAFNNMADTVGAAIKTSVNVMFKPLTTVFKGSAKILTDTISTGAKMALTPLSLGLNLVSFGTRNMRRRAKGQETKTLFEHMGLIANNIATVTKNQWANDDRDYGRGPLGSVNRFLTHGRDIFRNTREGIDAAKAGYRKGMTDQGFNSLNYMNVEDEQKRDKKEIERIKKDRNQRKIIDSERNAIARDNDMGQIFLSSEGLRETQARLRKAGVSEAVLKHITNNEDLNNFIYNKDDFMNNLGKKNPDIRDSAATQNFYETTKTYQSRIMAKFDVLTKEFIKFATRDAINRKKKVTIKDLTQIDKNLQNLGIDWDDIGIDPSNLIRMSDISDEDFHNYLNDKTNGKDSPTALRDTIDKILHEREEEKTESNEAIIDNLERLNQISEANARINAGEQMRNTGASESDIEEAAGMDFGSEWKNPANEATKRIEANIHRQKEEEESEKARTGHKSSQDEDENDKEPEADLGTDKIKDKDKSTVFGSLLKGATGLFGSIFGVVGKLFGGGNFWKTAGVTTMVLGTFGPWMKEMLGNLLHFLEPVGEFLKKGFLKGVEFLTDNLPSLVEKFTSNVVDNMGLIVDSTWKIVKAVFGTLGKKTANFIAKMFGKDVPYPEVDGGSGKKADKVKGVYDTEEEAKLVAEENDVNQRDGVILGSDQYFDENGDVQNIRKAGAGSAMESAARAGIQLTRSGAARKTGKLVLAAGKGVGKAGLWMSGITPAGKVLKGTAKGVGHVAKFGTQVLDKASDVVLKEGGKAASIKNSIKKLISTCVEKLSKFASKIKHYIPSVSKWEKAVKSFGDWALNKLLSSNSKILTKIGERIAAKTAKGTSKAIFGMTPIGLGFAAYDAVNGSLNASFLFGVNEDDVTGWMRAISSIMEILLGSPVGSILDIVFEVINLATGTNIKQSFARIIYKALWGDNEHLDNAIDELAAECEKYNDINGTNISVEEYNEKKNGKKTILGRIDNFFKKDKNKEDYSKYAVSSAELKNYQATHGADSTSEAAKIQNNSSNENWKTEDNVNYTYDASGVMFGPGDRRSVVYGAQADPRWANYELGKFPSGRKSTMATSGCGPTALSDVATSLGASTSPVGVASYAKKNGFIKDGGATTNLFTQGASDYGLKTSGVSKNNLTDSLRSGNPLILSGKSSSTGPYTEQGHVIVAKGMDNSGNAIVNDPMRGQRKIKPSELTKGMTNGWSYSRVVHGSGDHVVYELNGEPVSYGAGDNTGKYYFTYDGKRYKAIRDGKGNGAYKLVDPAEDLAGYVRITKPANFDPDTALSSNAEEYKGTTMSSSSKQNRSKNYINSGSITAMDSKYANTVSEKNTGSVSTLPKVNTVGMNAIQKTKLTEEDQKYVRKTLKTYFNDTKTFHELESHYVKQTKDKETKFLESAPSRLLETMKAGTLKTQSQLEMRIKNGYSKTNNEYKFNTEGFYKGLKVADLESLALYDSTLLTDEKIPKFKAIYKYYVKSGRYPLNKSLMDSEISSIFGKSEFVQALGGNGITKGYEYKYGFPFFQTDDSRWAGKKWRGATVKSRGGDLASLAMVTTAFGPNIIDPEYIYDKWISKKKNRSWYNDTDGLNFSKVFDTNTGYPSKKAAKVNGQPVKTTAIKNGSSIKSYLSAGKPVIMRGYRYKGSPFGGYYKKDNAPTSGPDDYSTIVGRAADKTNLVVLDPYTTRTQNGVFDINALTDRVGSSKVAAVKEAYAIAGPNGEVLKGKVDLTSKKGGKQATSLKKSSGLDKILAIFTNFLSIGENIFGALIGKGTDKSIFDKEEVEDDEELEESESTTSDDEESSSSSKGTVTMADIFGENTGYFSYQNKYYVQMGPNKFRAVSDRYIRANSGKMKKISVPNSMYNGTAEIVGQVDVGSSSSSSSNTPASGTAAGFHKLETSSNNKTSAVTPKVTTTGGNRFYNAYHSSSNKDAGKSTGYHPVGSNSIGGASRDLVFGIGDKPVVYGTMGGTVNANLTPNTIYYKDTQKQAINRQELTNIVNKIKNGQVLTNAERGRIVEADSSDYTYKILGHYLLADGREELQRTGVLSRYVQDNTTITDLVTAKKQNKANKNAAKKNESNAANSLSGTVDFHKLETGAISLDSNGDTVSAAIDSSSAGSSDISSVSFNIPEIQQFNGSSAMSPRSGSIEYVAMHYTTSASSSKGSGKNICNDWQTSGQASADFVVDDGEIWQYNPDPIHQYTWGVGDNKYSSVTTSLGASLHGIAGNPNVVSIEMQSSNKTGHYEDDATSTNWYFTEDVLNNAAGLASKLLNEYNLDLDHLIMHHHVSGKVCPGPFARNEEALKDWEAFKQRVASGSSSSGSSSSTSTKTTKKVDTSKLSASQKMAAYVNASIASLLGDDYETAKKKYLEMAAGVTTTKETTTTESNSTSASTVSGDVNLDPNNVEQGVWDYFKAKGWSDYGIAGLLGNMQNESGLVVNRKEGDFSNGYVASAEYTQATDAGSNNFGYDRIGYGLVQFTDESLKPPLLAEAKARGVSVSDFQLQLDEIDRVINSPGYNGLGNQMKNATSVADATVAFLCGYEKCGGYLTSSVQSARIASAQPFYDRHAGKSATVKGMGDLIPVVYGKGKKNSSSSSSDSSSTKNWLQIVADVKKLIAATQCGYNQAGYVNITYNGDTQSMRQDCSGFVGLCLYYYGIPGMLNTSTFAYYPGSSPLDGTDFSYMAFPGRDKLQAGDILIDQTHHVEVYAGNNQVYNCGSTNSVNSPGPENYYQDYPGIWRPNDPGSVSGVTSTSLTSDSDSSSSFEVSDTTTYTDPFTSMLNGLSGIVLETKNGVPIAFGPGDKKDPATWFTKTLGGDITSTYGKRNSTLGNEFHRGMDISAPSGRKIYSPVSGKVVSKGNDVAGYGNYAVIRDNAGKNHLFAHMQNPSYYGIGDSVNQADAIGEVGSTGRSTGSHLHYEIRNNGNKYSSIDPMKYSYDSKVSKSLNINNAHKKSYDIEEEAVGSGNRDVNTSVKDKLNVAINTKSIETKMDAMIEALNIMVDNTAEKQQPATSTITQNNTTVYGGGDRVVKKTSSSSTSSKSGSLERESLSLAEIHKSIASRA